MNGRDLLKLTTILVVLGAFEAISAHANSSSPVVEQNYSEPSGDTDTPTSASGTSLQMNGSNSSAPLIAAGDDVEVAVYGAPDLSMHGRVGADGAISMPLVGYVRIAGLSSSEAEQAIGDRLRRDNVVNHPQVSVYVKEYTSGEISVAGEVAKPGVYPALGPHRLFDLLQDAGGLTERAADRVIISHRSGGAQSPVQLPKDPEELAHLNINVLPGDTVVVPKAGIVYMLGAVNKPGGYLLNSGETVLQILAAAGGPTQAAALGGTKMLRRTSTGLQERPVPLKNLMHAKTPDIPLQADDIIFVPTSRMKEVLNAGALATTAGTAAIYRIP
jgi:polysaccharide export outer membrane protein